MTYFYLLPPQCKKLYHWIGTECVYRNLHIFHTFTSIFKTFFSLFPYFLEAKLGINVCLFTHNCLTVLAHYFLWSCRVRNIIAFGPSLFFPITLGFALNIVILVVSTRIWLGLLQISPEEGMIYIYLAKDSTILIMTSWIRERGLQVLDHLDSQMSPGPWPLLWDLSVHISLDQPMESVKAEYLQSSEREQNSSHMLIPFYKNLGSWRSEIQGPLKSTLRQSVGCMIGTRKSIPISFFFRKEGFSRWEFYRNIPKVHELMSNTGTLFFPGLYAFMAILLDLDEWEKP